MNDDTTNAASGSGPAPDREARLGAVLGDDAKTLRTPAEVLEYVERQVMPGKDFRKARKALEIAREADPQNVKLAQKLAVCTYKDNELGRAERYRLALEILDSIGLRDPERREAETLRLGGAVYKRMWKLDGQLEHLIEALALYRGAFEMDKRGDLGYGGVNAAFILDLLAARARVRARHARTEGHEAALLEQNARELREEVLREMDAAKSEKPALVADRWFAPTYAEAHFGLGPYDRSHYAIAEEYLKKTAELGLESWELETSFRQLVSIAKAQQVPPVPAEQPESEWHPAWKALRAYLGDDTRRALECYRGRVGLALSGGGFRASLFHIGVLARLAEMDVLRSVEVISTVSGGSVVGAHYYLELRQRLKEKTDGEMRREDYIEIVKRLEKHFLAGVQRNLRMRAFANPIHNLRMLFSKQYTRSHRIGELYESEIFSRVMDGAEGGPRYMEDLLIRPAGVTGPFKPNASNWTRRNRVPVLLLNTTSLNSGHSWHFTATWMGEPPSLANREVDKNRRYRRLYYHQVQPGFEKTRVGHAVAASACVPALFAPLEIHGLYPDRIVRLVDGGVHDNQGVAALLDEDCTLVLCSDASGQMDDAADPANSVIGVPLRANSILMDRVREAVHQDLVSRVDSRALEGLFFIHLKQNLPAPPISWEGCEDSWGTTPQQPTDGYGIDHDLQRALAGLRTDLDCFTEVEAYALMLSGYRMTEWKFAKLQEEHSDNGERDTWGGYDIDAPRSQNTWAFLDEDFERLLAAPRNGEDRRTADLTRQLQVGSSLMFRAFKLIGWLKAAGIGVLLALAAAAVWGIVRVWKRPVTELTWGEVVVALLVAAGVALVPILRWLNPEKATRKLLGKAIAGTAGALLAAGQVYLIDPLYRARGKLTRLLGRSRLRTR